MAAEPSLDLTAQTLSGLFIPPCPATLTSVMREAKRQNAHTVKIVELIEQDAGIVAPLLKLVNSPFFGMRNKIASVSQAVSIIGMQNTLNLVQNIALQQSLNGRGQNFEKFWERSSLSASIAERLAGKFPSISKDDAYITALFHDCGIPVLMLKFQDYRETVMEGGRKCIPICETEEKAFSTNHAIVGSMLTRLWALPSHVCKAIQRHHDGTIFSHPDESTGSDVRNLIGIVHMTECVIDEHLNVRDREWHQFANDVLNYFEISAQEFVELKGDALAYLNGE